MLIIHLDLFINLVFTSLLRFSLAISSNTACLTISSSPDELQALVWAFFSTSMLHIYRSTSLTIPISPDELQVLVWAFFSPRRFTSTSLTIPISPDELQALVWAFFHLNSFTSMVLPPLPSQSAQTSYKRSSGFFFPLDGFTSIILPPLLSQSAQTSACSPSGLFFPPRRFTSMVLPPLPSQSAQTKYKRSSGLFFYVHFYSFTSLTVCCLIFCSYYVHLSYENCIQSISMSAYFYI